MQLGIRTIRWRRAPTFAARTVVLVLRTSVGILIFHDVEVLDFAGPFEVFSRTRLLPGIDVPALGRIGALHRLHRGPQP